VIDLVSSDDEEEANGPFTNTEGPKANNLQQNDPFQSDVFSTDGEAENEWLETDDEHSEGVEPYRDQSSIDKLIDLTNQITIDDSDEEFGRKNAKPMGRPMRPSKNNSKKKFNHERERLSQDLFRAYDQSFCSGRLSSCTTVEWSKKLRTTAGLTRLRTDRITDSRTAIIQLSTKVLDDPSRLKNTLVHEMVHAAAFIIDGVAKPPHGDVFWKWANKAMTRNPDIQVTTTHSYDIEFKYAWACSSENCPTVIKRHSRSLDTKSKVCGRCRGNLIEIEVPRSGQMSHTPRKKAAPSAYNSFIKEICGQVRKELQQQQRDGPKVSQSEVMKECARRWRLKQSQST